MCRLVNFNFTGTSTKPLTMLHVLKWRSAP
jgi:hypothetical protein